MYIRRKVFSSVIDEETGEEKLFSTTEFINEDTYLEQKEYADKKDKGDKKKDQARVLRVGDKVGLWVSKNLNSKKDREALIEAYDEEGPQNSHKLGKQMAKYGGAAGAIIGGIHGARAGLKSGKPVGAVIGGVTGAGLGAGLGAGSNYVGGRLGSIIRRNVNDRLSTNSARQTKLAIDRHKVSSGLMSKDEYRKKHGRLVKGE